MKVILLGAPGSGKGTQAAYISDKYDLPHISTGDIFRENIKNMTPLGVKVKAVMDTGNLCPDDLTVEMVKERLSQSDCKNGYLLDGFPRNVFQAEQLDKFANVEKVVDISVDLNKLLRRITGRRVCQCGESYHVDFLEGKTVCSRCGGELYQRDDDTEEIVKSRLSVYQQQTAPLVDYYEKANKLLVINGDQSIDGVFAEIVKNLG